MDGKQTQPDGEGVMEVFEGVEEVSLAQIDLRFFHVRRGYDRDGQGREGHGGHIVHCLDVLELEEFREDRVPYYEELAGEETILWSFSDGGIFYLLFFISIFSNSIIILHSIFEFFV